MDYEFVRSFVNQFQVVSSSSPQLEEKMAFRWVIMYFSEKRHQLTTKWPVREVLGGPNPGDDLKWSRHRKASNWPVRKILDGVDGPRLAGPRRAWQFEMRPYYVGFCRWVLTPTLKRKRIGRQFLRLNESWTFISYRFGILFRRQHWRRRYWIRLKSWYKI